MLAWIRSPRGSIATATAVALVLAGAWALPRARQAAPPAPGSAASPVSALSVPPVADRAGGGVADPIAAVPAPVDTVTQDAPAIDIVRVDPHGETVLAGRGTPGEHVVLVDGGKVLAEVVADAGGQFAILPPALLPGEHYLTLQVTRNGTPSVSAQGVAVSLASNASPMVALMTPGQPVRVLSGAAKPQSRPAAANAQAPAPSLLPVAIQSVATEGGGTFTASGTADVGSQCRVYLNGAYLADVVAGTDGHWSVKVAKGMRTGRYTVRADQLEGVSGKVVNRAEVPFDSPATAAVGHARRMLMAKALAHPPAVPPLGPAASPAPVAPGPALASLNDAAAVIVKELQTATVLHGDSLWRISRKMLGHGINYTEIYSSNLGQIRNPRLIYPGQIFVVPHRPGQPVAAVR